MSVRRPSVSLSTPPRHHNLAVAFSLWAALILALCHASPAGAQDDAPDDNASDSPQRLALVIDASDSMAQTDVDGGSRMDAAKKATVEVLKEIKGQTDVGLLTYGSKESNAPDNKARGCEDVSVLAPVGAPDVERMTEAINELQPTGFTPIGKSLQKAAEELGDTGPRSIVLVSDGVDTCAPPAVCDVAKDLAGAGVDLAVHTVGFKVDGKAKEELECIANETGGTYTPASDAASLKDTLSSVVSRVGADYETTGTPLTLTDNPEDGLYVGEGQYLSEMEGPTESGDESVAKYFKVEVPEGTQTIVSAATIIPLRLENDSQTVYFHTNLEASNATCDETKDSNFASSEYPDPATATRLVISNEEGCDPKEWIVALSRGGSAYEPTLPVEIMVGHEPIVRGEEAGPEDPHEGASFEQDKVAIRPSEPKPTTGANSYSAATEITPGTYSDNIVAGETRYYKVDVPWGKRPVAMVEFDRRQARDPRNGMLEIATPWREIKSNFDFEGLDEDKNTKLDHQRAYYSYYRNRVGDNYASAFKNDSAFAGHWYVMVTLDGREDNGMVSEQESYKLTVALDGEEVAGPSWRPPSEAGPEPSITPISENSEMENDSSAEGGIGDGSENSGDSSDPTATADSQSTGFQKYALWGLVGLIALLALAVIMYFGVVVPRRKKSARDSTFHQQG